MKRNVFLSALVVIAVAFTTAFAQNTGTSKQKRDRSFPSEKLIKELNLSDKQVAEMKAADESFRTEMKSIRESDSAYMKQSREKKINAREKRQEATKNIMSKDQYIKYLEMQTKNSRKMMRKEDGNRDRMNKMGADMRKEFKRPVIKANN